MHRNSITKKMFFETSLPFSKQILVADTSNKIRKLRHNEDKGGLMDPPLLLSLETNI